MQDTEQISVSVCRNKFHSSHAE